MMKWTRTLLAVMMSLVLILSPLSALAEGVEAASETAQTPEVAEATQPPAVQTPEQTAPEESETPPPAQTNTPDATQGAGAPEGGEKTDPAQTETAPEAPVRVEELRFREPEVEVTLAQALAGLDYTRLNALRVLPENAAPEPLALSVRAEKDGRLDSQIASFVDYDEDGERLEGDYDDADVAQTRLEVYKAGAVYIRAALKSNEEIYAEFRLVIREESEPDTEPTSDGNNELPAENLLPGGASPSAEPDAEPTSDGNNELPTENLLPGDASPSTEPDAEPTADGLEPLPTEELLLAAPLMLSGQTPETLEPENLRSGESVQLSQSTLTLEKGQSAQLTATVSGIEPAPEVTWSIAPAEQTAVSLADGQDGSQAQGFVTVNALEAGSVTVTATVQGAEGPVSASCEVAVSLPEQSLSLNQSAYDLTVGEAFTLAATPVNYTGEITWTVDEAGGDVVRLGEDTGEGVTVTAHKDGAATVTASFTGADGQPRSAACTVTARYGEGLTLTGPSLLFVGDTAAFTLDGENFSADAPADCAVQGGITCDAQAGTVTAEEPGEAVLTAIRQDADGLYHRAALSVTVYAVPVLVAQSAEVKLNALDKTTVTVAGLPETDENPSLAWSVPGEAPLVGVSDIACQAGSVTAEITAGETAGTVNVTATYTYSGDKTVSLTLPVTVGVYPDHLAPADADEYTLAPGQTRQLSVRAFDKSGGDFTAEYGLTWTSSDEDVAAVSAGGLVTAGEKTGAATVTAASENGKTASFTISVYTISLSQSEGEVAMGETLTLRAVTAPEGLSVRWESGDETTLTVAPGNDGARLTPLKTGPVTVTATIEGTSISASCAIAVTLPATGIGFAGANFDEDGKVELFSGQSLKITAAVTPEGSTDALTWEYPTLAGVSISPAEDASGLTVLAEADAEGKMLVADGTEIELVARAGDVVETRTVVLRQAIGQLLVTGDLESREFQILEDGRRTLRLYAAEREGQPLGTGTTFQLSAATEPDGADDSATWKSSDPEVATVDENGLVQALKIGSAVITATSQVDPAKSCQVELTVYARAEFITLEKPFRQIHMYSDAPVVFNYNAAVSPAQDVEIFWYSSDESVATVDQQGNVTCLGAGDAYIFAYTSQTDIYAPVALGVVQVTRHATEISLHIDKFAGMEGLTLAVAQAISLSVSVLPEEASDTGFTLVPDDPSMLAVNGSAIRGLKSGSTYLSIVSNDVGEDGETPSIIRRVPITVVPKGRGVTSFAINKSSITLNMAQKYTLLSASSSKAYDKTVRWYSADTDIVQVVSNTSSRCYIQAGTTPGTTYLYAISSSGIIRSCKVTVRPQQATAVRIINPTNGAEYASTSGVLYVGETMTLQTVLYPDYISYEEDKAVQWRSTKPTVAMVNDEGKVYAVSRGTTYLYVRTTSGKTARFKLTVYNHTANAVLDEPASAVYLGGTAQMTYKVYLNGATDESPTLYELDNSLGTDYDNVHYAPTRNALTYDFTQMDYGILASSQANVGVYWVSQSTRIAKVSSAGLVTPVRAGTVRIGIKPRSSSSKYPTSQVYVTVEAPPNLALAVYDGEQAAADLLLTYNGGAEAMRQLTAAVTGAGGDFPVTWTSDNDRVACVDQNGLVSATGIGTTTLYAKIAGGLRTCPVNVTVQRTDGTSDVTYRALILARYTTAGQGGYLPFANNSIRLIRNTISGSNIDGERYSVTYNSSVLSASQMRSAISSAFSGSKVGDVNIIVTFSHGMIKRGEYRWATGYRGNYVTGSQIVSYANTYTKGDTVLCVASCYSGNASSYNSIIQRVKDADAERISKGTGSMSIICSTDNSHRSGFLNTSDSVSVEFLSVGLSNAVRSGGTMTIGEVIDSTKSATAAAVTEYKTKYGVSAIYGTCNVQTYVSPAGGDVVLFG